MVPIQLYCERMFDFEKRWRELDGVDEDGRDLVYDADADVFRFPDGRFALSREYADWRALKRAGFFREWQM